MKLAAVARRIVKGVRRPQLATRVALHEILFRPALNRGLAAMVGPEGMARLAFETIDQSEADPQRPTVLVLNRLYFEKDVVELKRRSKCFNYVSLHTHILSVTQANWLPAELQEQISYAPRTTLSHSAAWENAERYAAAVIRRAREKWNVVAVLASNIDYWQHESFRSVCGRIGLPFLVLCQEQQTVPEIYNLSLKLYRDAHFRFTGTAVAVFEKRTKDMLVECGCCIADQVDVTGAPRLDPWFDPKDSVEADTFTLLAFEGEQYFAPLCYLDTLKAFARASLAHRGRGMTFLVKCKDAEDLVRHRAHLAGIAHDLEVTCERALPEVMSRSRVVIGYNTLAILEGLLSAAELVVPCWADADKTADAQILDSNDADCQQHFRFVRSVSDFERVIAETTATPPPPLDMAGRHNLLRRWFHLSESGHASPAVDDFVARWVERCKALEAAA